MSTVKTPAKKIAGNTKTEVIIGKASAELSKGLSALSNAVEKVNSLNDIVEQQTLKVTNLDNQIEELEQRKANIMAQNEIEIENHFASKTAERVGKYLSDNNLISIDSDKYDAEKKEAEDLRIDFNKKLQSGIAAATVSLNKEHENALKVKELEYSSKEASNIAKITQLEEKVTFLQDQIHTYKSELASARELTKQVAEAGKIDNINVGTNK